MPDVPEAIPLSRRQLLWCSALPWLALPLQAAAAQASLAERGASATVQPGVRLVFPRDHGAHPGLRTEWWYATGSLQTQDGQALGFQLTFFRTRTDVADLGDALAEPVQGQAKQQGQTKRQGQGQGAGQVQGQAQGHPDGAGQPPGRFAPRQLLLAHAALTDVAAGQLWHGQRIARWNGDPAARPTFAALADTHIRLADWALQRHALPGGHSRYTAMLGDADVAYQLELTTTQPRLLQGQAGYSRKGPGAAHASHYYSQPQLAVTGTVQRKGRTHTVTGTAWLDHEWSETLMPTDAVGWDWIGMNLHNGAALTVFRLRRADGTAVWAGGSWRTGPQTATSPRYASASADAAPHHALPTASPAAQAFGADEVVWQPLAWWVSPLSGARYPVRWAVTTPAGRFEVHARVDAQELDSRATTGAIYWEGLSDLIDPTNGQRVGQGYLEMTGYAQRLVLG
ncbi:MAG: carotenoid 1,2-hydratase [Burkholderiales bacterium]|nr:carotenoid 1,2-hydratase [Burkholderiales bacterium]